MEGSSEAIEEKKEVQGKQPHLESAVSLSIVAQNFNIYITSDSTAVAATHHKPQSRFCALYRNEHNVLFYHAPRAPSSGQAPHSIAQDIHDPRPSPTLAHSHERRYPKNSSSLKLHPLDSRIRRYRSFERHLSTPCPRRYADSLRTPKYNERTYEAGSEAQTWIPMSQAK
ncbi:hypothetical protein FOQG_02197 [Fusarium oxysporum f. sp. raphani 54005]|uniref:Uncharacterized protein n=2 Tax=Fusarium oxysporum TaxID=5507 RepID=X0DR75_FUSOX|nr:hypothetical protein FOVG_07244 [Fusarium oxysporum f. sp. pisi HDV247]EXK96772.1 hypothetical protein FOQG_02197 [Fusarium oxysporum f. sp. raphani 54005]